MKNKICTTIEQSKKLIELGLDPKTADMHHFLGDNNPKTEVGFNIENVRIYSNTKYFYIPAWSLSRLLVIIRDQQCVWLGANDVASWVTEFNLGSGKHHTTDPTMDPLDAAYNCLVWLIENGEIDTKNITI